MIQPSYQNLRHDQPEPGIHLVTIDRPKALNALDSATLAELACVVAGLATDADARALLLTGGGPKAFVAGADISEMQALSPEEARSFSSRASRIFLDMEALSIPVIALVNGYALGGGCELALACDWIVAADNAVFGQPEVNLGIPPGFGGTQRLPRRIAPGKAMELLVTGRSIDPARALELGLINRIVPDGQQVEAALELSAGLAALPARALQATKRLFYRTLDVDFAHAMQLAHEAHAEMRATAPPPPAP